MNMGSAGDSPAPAGDPPAGTALSIAKRPFTLPYLELLFPFHPREARGFLRKSACLVGPVPSPGGFFNGRSDSLCPASSVALS